MTKPVLLVADNKGKIFPCEGYLPAVMKAGIFFPSDACPMMPLPRGSEIFMLPGRAPVGIDGKTRLFACPVPADGGYHAVAAFLSPGVVSAASPAYYETGTDTRALPLFSYSACFMFKGKIYASGVRVDDDTRHDFWRMNPDSIKKGIKKFKKLFPKNGLVPHLEKCVNVYSCPNAMNLFLSRHEAPLPVSPSCNASCAGCISKQAGRTVSPQNRITFVPRPGEIAEIALYHFQNAKGAIVSFGQGCEGEPLLSEETMHEAILMIRRMGGDGTINLNTNASRPEAVSRLFDAGLDSIRVSMNSAREKYYRIYYRPKGYGFRDVIKSIKAAKKKKGFVSINYLAMPGFTDERGEFEALKRLSDVCSPDMVQMRNLNYDPRGYFKLLGVRMKARDLMGIDTVITKIKKDLGLAVGYFNPLT